MVRTGQRILAVLLPDHKVKLGLAWASILAVLCVALSVAISMFGMRGFDMILGNNARSLSLVSDGSGANDVQPLYPERDTGGEGGVSGGK